MYNVNTMIKNELQVMSDAIGGNAIFGTLGCKRMMAEDTLSIVLSEIKTSKKVSHIKILWIDSTHVELTFYKQKSREFKKLQQSVVLISVLRKEISDFLKIDI